MQTTDVTKQRGSWLTPGVLGIGLASLLADAGHEIPTALLPSFLTSTLGAPAAALGLIEGLADGAAGGARLLGGALADDPGLRRRTATGGYVGTAVLAALIGLTGRYGRPAAFASRLGRHVGSVCLRATRYLPTLQSPRPTVALMALKGRWTTSGRLSARSLPLGS